MTKIKTADIDDLKPCEKCGERLKKGDEYVFISKETGLIDIWGLPFSNKTAMSLDKKDYEWKLYHKKCFDVK